MSTAIATDRPCARSGTVRYFKARDLGPFFSHPRRLHYLVRLDPDDSVWLEYADGVETKHVTMTLQEVMHHYRASGDWVVARLEDLERATAPSATSSPSSSQL